MSQFVFFNYYCVVIDLFQSWKKEEWIVMTMKMRLKLALQLLEEVKENTRDGNTPGYLMNKILIQLFVSFVIN